MSTSDTPTTTEEAKVYAHSGDTLFRMNPLTFAPQQIGSMGGIDGSLLDLAVDKNDRIVGITRDKFYLLNASNGAATLLGDLSSTAQGFTSLSFTPSNPSDPASPEILISANASGDVFRIDISGSSASATKIGNYGLKGSAQIASSGDIFGVIGFGIYATVDVGADGDTANDYLAKIDPMNNWKATPLPQSTGYNKIFGLGFWGGRIYGFVDDGFESSTGKMIQIDPVTGAGTLLSSGAQRWFGAGVATDAPTIF